MRRVLRAVPLLLLATLGACGSEGTSGSDYVWDLPEGFPEPAVPEDNPMSAAKVELGRYLFYDTELSGNRTMACASCHLPSMAFTDGRAVGLGSTGHLHPRGPLTLANVAYARSLTWANPLMERLEDQARVPLFGDLPVELGLRGAAQMLERLKALPRYRERFAAAYPELADPINEQTMLKALACFERSLISGGSAYDRDELSASARRGNSLFHSEAMECFHCHGGFDFTDHVITATSANPPKPYHNNALYNIGGNGAYPAGNAGLYEFTQDPAHMGRFKAPTLRNIELTAPYMHDGSLPTLEAVIEHYARGGRKIEDGPYAGDGARSPVKSGFVSGFPLSAQDKADLLEFLRSLTDWDFVCRPALQDPFGRFPPHSRCAAP